MIEALWRFNCSSIRPGFVGNLTGYAHLIRLNDFHEYLQENPPFLNQMMPGTVYRKGAEQVAPNTTAIEANTILRNPFTFDSQLMVSFDDEGNYPATINNSNLTWNLGKGSYPGMKYANFVFSCSVKGKRSVQFPILQSLTLLVWDVTYTMINNKVEGLVPTLSNGSVAGIVSIPAGGLSSLASTNINRVHQQVNRDQSRLTPSIIKERYEVEMSKALSMSLAVHSIPVPVDAVQLRRSEVITKLPALALWLLVTANLLFMLLAIVMAIFAVKSASNEVHQVQLRLSSAGLASQLFSSGTAKCAAKDEFDLFHTSHAGDEYQLRQTISKVEVRNTDRGGAEFVFHSLDEELDNDNTEQCANVEQIEHLPIEDQTLQQRLLTRRAL